MLRKNTAFQDVIGPPRDEIVYNVITGTEDGDVLVGTAGDDHILGLGGNDEVGGGDGNDRIEGGGGFNWIEGEAGDDLLTGGDGTDLLYGGAGNDIVHGGGGQDFLEDYDGGSDQLYGEGGDDLIDVNRQDGTGTIHVDGGDGNDGLMVTAWSGSGAPHLEVLGGDGGDEIYAAGGASLLIDAGAGSDYVIALRGSSGIVNYTITLGAGSDVLAGVVNTSLGSVVVTDFEAGDSGDALWLENILFSRLTGWNTVSNPFASGHLRLVQSGADTLLQMDLNGTTGGASFTTYLTLQNVTATSLTARNLGGYASDGSVAPGQTIAGTAEVDSRSGTMSADTMAGGDEDDFLFGAGGDDVIDGGEGWDDLYGGNGSDVLHGEGGNDLLQGGFSGNDQLFGGDGADQLFASFLIGGGWNVILDGGAGNDRLTLSASSIPGVNAAISGGGDNDYIEVRGGATVTIDAGDGNDSLMLDVPNTVFDIALGAGADKITLYSETVGGAFNMTVSDFTAGAGGDKFDLTAFLPSYLTGWSAAGGPNPFSSGYLRLIQSGADTLLQIDRNGATGGAAWVTLATLENTERGGFTADNFNGFAPHAGTPGDDVIDGTPGADTLEGFGGDDILSGLGGNDTLDGGDDDDILLGGDGNDQIAGGDGGDLIDAGAGDDVVLGGAGRDDVIGGLGDDELHGGGDIDFLFDTDGNNDALYGDDGDDLIGYGAILSDAVSDALLDGGAGDDEIHYFAYNFDDLGTVLGGDGNDRISSAGGDHLLIDAGAGADLVEVTNLGTRYDITLGAGSDRLWLNGFQDLFADSAGLVVTDFAAGDAGDTLSIVQYLTTVTLGWDRTGNPFASGYLQVIQRGADAVVQLDRDGVAGGGSGFADLVVLQNVTASALTAHNLGFAPDGAAPVDDTLTGTAGRDLLSGADGDDVITGLGDNDRLYGGAGDDRLEGGDGIDTLDGELGDDALYGGADTDFMGDSLGGNDQLFGEGGRDLIQVTRQLAGTPTSNVLIDGGDDTDTLIYFGAPASGDEVTVLGGAGEDLITVYGGGAVTIDGGDGPEIVTIDVTAASYAITLGPSPVDGDEIHLQYTSAAITSFTVLDFVAGNGGDMLRMTAFLTGALSGWDGIANPFATGHLALARSGADALILIDRDGGGDAFALLGRLTDVDAALLTDINLGFLPGPVALAGSDGDNSIGGTPGADTMIGLGGNDTYLVDNAGDIVVEAPGGGNDRVVASLSYALTAGAEVETLQALGTGPLDLTGSDGANSILGNDGVNILRGRAGDDSLSGLGGDDFLIGGIGADAMAGGLGNDTYYVDGAGDLVTETAGQGNDRIATSVTYALAAGSEVETLEAINSSATDALDLTGNGFANTITGTAGVNILRGDGGSDILGGLAGNDFLVGGAGADFMYGGQGDDTYYVDDLGDQANEAAGEGTDRIATSISYALLAGSEIELLESVNTADTGGMDLTGSDSANTIIANNGVNLLRGRGGNDVMIALGGNDYLDGGTGADLMYGGTGDDVYYVDNEGDQAFETAGEGTDRIATSISYALNTASEIELLESVNTADTGAMDLTGSDSANAIIGNNGVNILRGEGGNDTLTALGGDDFLVGGGGNDTMFGGAGNDTYYVDAAGDVVIEVAGEGSDRVVAAASYALGAGAEVETLEAVTRSATNAMDLAGSASANAIFGNDGANTLDGKGGNDVLWGHNGADTFAFTTTLGAGNVDRIADFVSGTDKIALDDAIFGALGAGAFAFGTQAGDADDRIVYNSATGELFFDPDGNGAGAAILFATLDGHPPLAAGDFMVI